MNSSTIGRREFMKIAGAGALAAPALARGLAARADARGSDEIRVGLIGCGGRGTGAAVQALRADKGAVLVAMGDIFADRLDSSLKGITGEMGADAERKVRVPREKQFVGFDAYKQVIDSGVDVVLLTSYPCFRPQHLKAAAEAGKHVFAEKPLAVDAPGLRSVLESAKAARDKNLALMVGFCWRYHTGMREVFSKVSSGAIGDIVSVHTTYHTTTLTKRPRRPEWSDVEFQMRNWWHFTWLSGDHIVEQAIHSIDRMAWAVNDRVPRRVTCLGGRAARSGPEHGNVYDHFAAVYEYEGAPGPIRCFHTCRQIDNCPSDNTDYIEGTAGSCTVNGWGPTLLIKDRSGKEVWKGSGTADDAGKMYQNEHDELFASIRAGKPINDAERGARATLMAIMARMAAYTGQTVTWEQALNSKDSLVPDHLELGAMPAPPVAVPGKTALA